MRLVHTWFSSPGIPSMAGTSAAYSRTTVTPGFSLWASTARVLSNPSVTSMRCTAARSSWE